MSTSTLAPSRNGSAPALSDMSVPQLTSAYRSLNECQGRYDRLSGIVATMKGFVLTEVKHKLEHGKFLPWLREHFPKSRVIAAQDMRLAAEFFKSKPTFTFETLGRDLATTLKEIEEAQLDLRHPLVREVSGWVGDRTRYQLLLDFPSELGGARKKSATADSSSGEKDPHATVLEAWTLLVDELSGRAFGDHLYTVEWGLLTTPELKELDDRILRVHQHFAETIEARKISRKGAEGAKG